MVQSAIVSVGQEVILAARDVSKFYEAKTSALRVLASITLELHAGEFVALLGPSGSEIHPAANVGGPDSTLQGRGAGAR